MSSETAELGRIRSATFFWAICDNCDEPIGANEEFGHFLDETEAGAKESVTLYGGEVESDGRFTCATCLEDGFDPKNPEVDPYAA